MRITLHVEIDSRSRATRIAFATVASVVVLLAGAAVVRASVPNTFKAGDILSSSAVNENFVAVASSTYTNDAGITKRSTAGATKFCGVTGTAVSGNLGGYAAAKQTCETTCSSATAHMCVGDELVRSAAIGMPVPGGWFSAGFAASVTTGGTFIRDCQSWSTTSSSDDGNVWPNSNDACAATHPILCCD
jgi:hypothetical protein